MPDPAAASDQTHFGYETVGLEAKQGRVNEVFHGVAGRYDLMNDLMSGGLHRAWKNALVNALNLPRGGHRFDMLDVAGGTGDIAFRALGRGGPGVHVTLLDINHSMLEVGRARAQKRGLASRIDVVEANAESLPFPAHSFDAVTIAFGLRNVPRIPVALKEMRRVLKPGGRFFCLEFSTVEAPVIDRVYDLYSFNMIPRIGKLVAGDADPYRYLVESIRRFPPADELAAMMREAGLQRVGYDRFTGGVACLHHGWRL